MITSLLNSYGFWPGLAIGVLLGVAAIFVFLLAGDAIEQHQARANPQGTPR